MQVRPKKSLGQHFLRDENIARKIVQSLEAEAGETVLELGPGTGVLSKYLFETYPGLQLIEIDREAWAYLQELYPGHSANIHLGDFLKSRILEELDPPVCIIGNFPYNVSSRILFRILENRQQVSQVVCMLQKEVADRISSAPGSKVYGILSVLLQAFYDIEPLFNVSPSVFTPPPKIRSSVIRLIRNGTGRLDCDEELFFRTVKTSFNQRRKTLRNSLKALFILPDPLPGIFGLRPEQLGVDEFVELTNLIRQPGAV